MIFFIDDGSTDLTKEIVTNEFPNVHYYYQTNSGVSAARNKGLDLTIDYRFIMFVDSDDWLENDCISKFKLDDEIKDFTFCDWIEHKTNQFDCIYTTVSSANKNFTKSLTVDDLKKHYLRFRSGGSPWGKIYINSILKTHDIRFKEGLPYAEDYLFNLEYLKYCESVSYIQKGLYNYNCLLEGARGKFRQDRCQLTIQIEKKKIQLYDINSKSYKKYILAEMVEQFAIVVLNFYNSKFQKERRKLDRLEAKRFLMSIGVGALDVVVAETSIKSKLLCLFLFL